MNYIKAIIILFVLLGLTVTEHAYASPEADHEHSETKIEGPNGGTFLSEGEFAVEITIFELGNTPEMRVYTYLNEEIIEPDKVNLEVVLHRLGNTKDTLSFTPEGDYLVSNTAITEPHSYEVYVTASTQNNRGEWHYESFEGRTTLSDRVIESANILVENAMPRTLRFKDQLFGVVAPVSGQAASVRAVYPGVVSDVFVSIGAQVSKGQVLARIRNSASGASYEVISPIAGEVTERFVTAGEIANEQVLFEIVDLSTVWVELSAFPQNIEKLKVGLQAEISDLHQHERISGEIIYIAPVMTGGHISRARVLIENKDRHWRPGMHVQAEVTVGEKEVALAVNMNAVQSFRGMPIVFAQYGNTFEIRVLELGDSDGDYIEVKAGLVENTPYVFMNSYLLKADVLKDGASHNH